MISVAGTLVADLLVRPIRNWAGKGHNANVDTIDLLPGGTVANTGLALTRLGVPVSALGAVGEDSFGTVVHESIGRWAARNRVVAIPSTRTTGSVVAVFEDGDRCFLSAPGACDQFNLTPADLESEIAAGSRALHLGYAGRLPMLDGEPLEKIMRLTRDLGALTSLDVTYFPDPRWPQLMKLMPEIDVFCPSLVEATAITGKKKAEEAAAALVEAGVQKFVAVTDGPNGAVVHVVGEGQEFIPARPVKAIDTTGAGDSFIAGVLAAWYRGSSWRIAGRMGAFVASIAVTSSTRYENLRSYEELLSELPISPEG
jgi:sugar/nucleoside kinase (ribokinase family)